MLLNNNIINIKIILFIFIMVKKKISMHEEYSERGGKVFVADCIELGISDFGDTVDGALNNLRNAITLLLEEAPEKKELLSKPQQILTTRIFL